MESYKTDPIMKPMTHPLTHHDVVNATSVGEVTKALYNWYFTWYDLDVVTIPEGSPNKCKNKNASPINSFTQEHIPTLPQALINRIFKLEGESDSRRGMLAWHSTGSGKTTCASGVMDAFWESKRQIVYASSIGALASNPPENFKEAMKMYPSAKGRNFENRDILFISFARLANRIAKAEKLKKLLPKNSNSNSNNGSRIASPIDSESQILKKKQDLKLKQKLMEKQKQKRMRGGVSILDSVKNALTPAPATSPSPLIPSSSFSTPIDSSTVFLEETKEKGKEKQKSDGMILATAVSNLHSKDEEKAKKEKADKESEKAKPGILMSAMTALKNLGAKKPEAKENALTPRAPANSPIELPKPDYPERKTPNNSPEKPENIDFDDMFSTPSKSFSPSPSKRGSPSPKPSPKIEEDEEDEDDEETYVKLPLNVKIATTYDIYPSAANLTKISTACKQCNIRSFADFVDLDKCVLIVDEVHNLFRPLPAQKKQHQYVEKQLINPAIHPGLKIVILTATPGSSVKDVLVLLNMVSAKGQIQPPIADNAASIAAFKESIRGLISFYDMSSDEGYFPRLVDPGPVSLPMSMSQFEKYATAYSEVTKDHKDYDALANKDSLGKFYNKARKYSNMLYNFDKGVQLEEFSIKLPQLLDTIEQYPNEKHYVYSYFGDRRGTGQGILEIARQLESRGYKRALGKQLSLVKKGKTSTSTSASASDAPHYVLALDKEPIDSIVKAFNDPSNIHGAKIHVFLASQGYNEGIDLKGIRHIHIFEPLVTMASDMQTIGRARRFCSHADLPHESWTVQIHRYLADLPIEILSEGGIQERLKHLKGLLTENMTKAQLAAHKKEIKQTEKLLAIDIKAIDSFVYENAKVKMHELFTIYMCMQEAAVDCTSLINFHGHKKNPKFKCLV